MVVFPKSCDVSKIQFDDRGLAAAIDDEASGSPTRVIYREIQEDHSAVYFIGIPATSDPKPGRNFTLKLMPANEAIVLFGLPENMPTKTSESTCVWFGPFNAEQTNLFNRVILLEFVKRNAEFQQRDLVDALAGKIRHNPPLSAPKEELVL